MTDQPDPRKVKVQLNVPLTWEFMAHLDHISQQTKIPKAQLVRTALEEKYPLTRTRSFVKPS
jgi:predicted DNA-binding protein